SNRATLAPGLKSARRSNCRDWPGGRLSPRPRAPARPRAPTANRRPAAEIADRLAHRERAQSSLEIAGKSARAAPPDQRIRGRRSCCSCATYGCLALLRARIQNSLLEQLGNPRVACHSRAGGVHAVSMSALQRAVRNAALRQAVLSELRSAD